MIEEREMMKFSWTGRFLVTGFSSFLFSIMLKILDGNHSRFLLLTGAVTLSLGILSWVGGLLSASTAPGKKSESSLSDF